MDIGELEQAEPFVTVDGSIIREVAGPVSLPSAHQSLAEATLPAWGNSGRKRWRRSVSRKRFDSLRSYCVVYRCGGGRSPNIRRYALGYR